MGYSTFLVQAQPQGRPPSAVHSQAMKVGIISIVAIIALSFGLFFYIQDLTQASIKSGLFEQQKERQLEATRSISMHIGSDLDLIVGMLDGLSNSYYFQQGDLHSDQAKSLMEEKYSELNPTINRLFVLDKDNIVTISLAPAGSETFLSADFSLREWVIETRSTLEPVFSDGFERQGIYRIFISYPIINRETDAYVGTIVTSIPTEPFFAHYAAAEDVKSQFLVVYNKQGIMLSNGASNSLVGQSFFGEETQKFIEDNQVLNDLTRSLLDGNSGFGVYDHGRGERLTTQYPIFVQGKPAYFVQLVTPTELIYSDFSNAFFTEGSKLFLLLASTISAISVLAVFLIKWNTMLNKEVQTRTAELKEANERLNDNIQMQQEFLDIAAHELRTPIQPILGLTQVLYESRTSRNSSNPLLISSHGDNIVLETILRNAQRLEQLTEDLLDVTRIEGKRLQLNKERLDLTQLVQSTVQDFRNVAGDGNGVQITAFPSEPIFASADKSRIIQVLSNLLQNAIKFTKQGTISISLDKQLGEAIVAVSDTGIGIDDEILPRLFTKFATKSAKGTGLGLFISKGIIELHSGRIWGENNKDGMGATFKFSLPFID